MVPCSNINDLHSDGISLFCPVSHRIWFYQIIGADVDSDNLLSHQIPCLAFFIFFPLVMYYLKLLPLLVSVLHEYQ